MKPTDQTISQTAFGFHLVGAGRGGTSLLAGLIDAHPDCEVTFEEFSIGYLMGTIQTEAENYRDAAMRVALRVDNFLQACESHGSKDPAKKWGHKTTTEQIAGLRAWQGCSNLPEIDGFDSIEYFLKRVSHVPTIFITRDGRTCIASKVRRTGQPLETAITRWQFSVEVLRRLARTAALLHIVKMEELIDSPLETLKTICQFLGIEYSDRMQTGTDNPKMLAEYRRVGFDRTTTKIEDTPSWISRIHEELTYCGYEI